MLPNINMTTHLACLVSICLVACNNEQPAEDLSSKQQSSANTSFLADAQPCELIMLSVAGDESNTDQQRTQQLQARVTANPGISGHVERLGWEFVALARQNHDPGFFTLALHAASCLDQMEAGSSESLLLGGHVLLNLHRFAEAEIKARELVSKRGLWFDYALLGDVLLDRGLYGEAAEAYQSLADLRPGPEAYSRVARLHALKGKLDSAMELMSLALQSSSTRNREFATWMQVELARMSWQSGDEEFASALIESALNLQAGYPSALFLRGRISLATGQFDDAVTDLERAVTVEPLPEYRWALLEAYQAAGLSQLAAEQQNLLVREAGFEDPRTASVFLATLGIDRETAVRLSESELEARRDVFTLDAAAWAMVQVGSFRAAQELSSEALAVGTVDARLFYHGGVIAARTGDQVQARSLLAQAREMSHMLLPSEQQQLEKEFAALAPQTPNPAS